MFVVLGSLLCLAGCSSPSEKGEAKSPPSSAPTSGAAEVPVRPGVDASATIGGFTVSVPGHAVGGEGRMTAASSPAPETAVGLRRVGTGVRVDLDGGQLKGVATVSFPVPAQWDQRLLPIIAWQDGHGGWRWLPTTWTPGQLSATAQTDHFSSGFLGSLDVRALAGDALKGFTSWMTGRADVAAPRCAAQDTARAKVRVSSDGGDSVKWCLGVEGGKTVLKIANNRITYTQITYPSSWKVLSGQRYGISLDALTQFTATKAAQALTRPGKSVILIDKGKTVSFSLPSGADARVLAEISFYAYAFEILGLAFQVETKVAELAGVQLGKNGLDRLIRLINGTGKLDAWGEAGRDCLQSFTEEFTNELTEPVEPGKTAGAIITMAGKCVVAMGKISASESGPLIFFGSLILDAVMTVVTAVITAVKLLVVSIREIWDSLASFGGKSNPIYLIRLTPTSVPTQIVKINPLSATGKVKSGYQVQPVTDGALDCSFGPSASPSAVSGGIYECGGTASYADVCWVPQGSPDAYCGGEPWNRTLRQWPLSEWPLPAVEPRTDPRPWGVVLADGTKCRRRIGGAWSGRPDGWIPNYGCEGKEFVVLSDPTGKHPDVDESKPTWVVRIGELSDTAKSLPAPQSIAVRTAYFATDR
ncbi:hypothetical protein [Kribbella sp. ALI-6-A]|uniref:hypothetical protein n=1 Tax=Kribbella sp. ALI-6-A TaxID=1933817 RepID=UPI001179BF05|nr:hypothetical protein [Kribbella sp. ALI-6-A]